MKHYLIKNPYFAILCRFWHTMPIIVKQHTFFLWKDKTISLFTVLHGTKRACFLLLGGIDNILFFKATLYCSVWI